MPHAAIASSITATYPHQHPAKEVCFLPLMSYMLTCKEASERHCLALPVSTMMESGSACKEEVSLGFRRLAIGRVINRTTTTGKEELHVTNMVLQLSPTQGMDSCSQAHCTSADLLPRLHTSTMSLWLCHGEEGCVIHSHPCCACQIVRVLSAVLRNGN